MNPAPDYINIEGEAFELVNVTIDKAVKFTAKALDQDRIDQMMLPTTEAEGKWYEVEMAGSEIDRHKERFSEEVLRKYAEDINREGSTFNFGHSSDNLIGKVSNARVEGGSLKGFVWVDELATMPNQPKMSVNHAIQVGIIKDVSVEVSGTIKAVEDHWEYYIDPAKRNSTEFHGLALVKKGAQRNASLVVKSIESIKKSNHLYMSEVIIINGKKHYLNVVVYDGGALFNQGEIQAIEHEIASLETEARKALELEGEVEILKSQIAKIKESFIADISYCEKTLGLEASADLNEMDVEGLAKKASELMSEINKSAESKIEPVDTLYSFTFTI